MTNSLDVDPDVSTAYCKSSSGDGVDWFQYSIMHHGGPLLLVHFDPAIVSVYHGFLRHSLICRTSLALMFSNCQHPRFRYFGSVVPVYVVWVASKMKGSHWQQELWINVFSPGLFLMAWWWCVQSGHVNIWQYRVLLILDDVYHTWGTGQYVWAFYIHLCVVYHLVPLLRGCRERWSCCHSQFPWWSG